MDRIKINPNHELYCGAKKLADAVAVTLGPRGKLVIIDNGIDIPHLTKDGVTVANAIKLKDPIQNSGAQILRESSRKTAIEAGDGTTTTAILGAALIQYGLEDIESNISREFFDALDTALQFSLNELEKIKIDVVTPEQIKHIATISANSDEFLGDLLSSAINKLGPNATILVEESKNSVTELEFVDGTEIDRGYVSQQFLPQNQNKIKYEDPLVLICMKKMISIKEIMLILENLNKRPLIIFAEDFDNEILKALIVNNQKSILKTCCIKLPEFNQGMFESAHDLAALFGTKVYYESDFPQGIIELVESNKSLHASPNILKEFLGTCKLIEISRNKTTILKPKRKDEEISSRITNINEELNKNINEDREKLLKRRMQRLSDGIAVLKIGASTEIELKEKLDRVDDAVNATRVAAIYGILPGSGISLKIISDKLKEKIKHLQSPGEIAAYRVFSKALIYPSLTILKNAGFNYDDAVKLLSQFNYSTEVENNATYIGYNALTREMVNLIEVGIIDPYYVTINCLKNSLSVAKKILEVGCFISSLDSFENEEI